MATKKTTTPTKENYDLSVFNVSVKPELLTQAIFVYQSNLHNQAAKVKTRGEVDRTNKKVYKQKHTGNARHGARSANVFVGGGIVFGPTGVLAKPKKLNQKMKLLSLAGIMTQYQQDKMIQVVTPTSGKVPSIKTALSELKLSPQDKKVTLVYQNEDKTFLKSVSNLNNLSLASASRLNIIDVVSSRRLLLTPSAYQTLVTRLQSVL